MIIVRVADANDDRSRFPDAPFSEVPHGKQSWYGPIGGIWQSVTLNVLPSASTSRRSSSRRSQTQTPSTSRPRSTHRCRKAPR